MAQADVHPSIDVVFRVGVTLILVIREVHLWSQRINPAPDDVRAHSFIHEQVAYMGTVLFGRYVHVDLVPQDLEKGSSASGDYLMQGLGYLLWLSPPHLLIHQETTHKVIPCLVVKIVCEQLSHLPGIKYKETI